MFEERQQPHSIEIERSILAAAMKGEMSTIYDNRVDVNTFYSHIHREIFKAILELKKSGTGIDSLTVSEKLLLNGVLEDIGGQVFIAKLYMHIATTVNLDAWIKLHLEYHAKRLMINSCSETLQECYGDNQNALDLFNNHRSSLKDVEMFSCGMLQKPTIEKLGDFVGYLKDLQTGTGGIIIPFGIPGLDELIMLQLKQLLILGGLSGTGKTRFILCDAIGKAEKNVASAIFSFENPTNIIVSGIVSIMSDVPMFQMTKPGGLNERQMDKIAEAMKFLKDNSHLIHIFGKGDYVHSVSGISAEIRRIQDSTGGRLKTAYIDHLQNMKGDSKQAKHEQIESSVYGISEFSAEHNIASILLTQLNRDKARDVGGRRPILADTKGSGAIEDGADYVVFLHKANKAETGDIELDFYTEKVRGTNTFDKKIKFNTNTGKMSGIVSKYDKMYKNYPSKNIKS